MSSDSLRIRSPIQLIKSDRLPIRAAHEDLQFHVEMKRELALVRMNDDAKSAFRPANGANR